MYRLHNSFFQINKIVTRLLCDWGRQINLKTDSLSYINYIYFAEYVLSWIIINVQNFAERISSRHIFSNIFIPSCPILFKMYLILPFDLKGRVARKVCEIGPQQVFRSFLELRRSAMMFKKRKGNTTEQTGCKVKLRFCPPCFSVVE